MFGAREKAEVTGAGRVPATPISPVRHPAGRWPAPADMRAVAVLRDGNPEDIARSPAPAVRTM